MDSLSWFLVFWIVISAVVFFFVQNILPLFIPPIERQFEESSKIDEKHQKSNMTELKKEELPILKEQNLQKAEQQQPLAAFSSWAASTFGVGQQPSQIGETCNWVNDLLSWIYRHIRHSPDLSNAWLRAMNDAASKVALAFGCDIYFEEVLAAPEDAKEGPRLTSIRSEFGPREHLTMRANVTYPKLAVRLVASQKLPDRLLVTNYVATLRNISGQAHVRIACIGDDLFFMLCFEGKPDLSITFETGDQTAAESVDQTLVDEILKRCLASAVTNVSLAKLQESPAGNKAVVNGSGAVMVSAADIKQCQAVTMQDRQRSNRLLLKVERAEKLGGGKRPLHPYVIVEMDEPAQKHTTTLGFKGDPVWEEQFLFELYPRSEELLFEVYEHLSQELGRSPVDTEQEPRFLGLAIVGIEELRQAGNQTHILTLQGRPYKDDDVSGTLTVEFIFLREQFAETKSGRRASRLLAESAHQQTRPLHVVTDFRPSPGCLKTAHDSPYIDGEKEPLPERRPGPPPKVRDQTPVTSDSEMSVTSTDSVYPQSKLIVEIVEDGAKKYYLLPIPVQRHALGKKLMKVGKKLHIFNDHTFTAVKTRAGGTCGVCNAPIATAFRRKGYQCRDCGFICHKRCHFKVVERCPFSKLSNIPL